MTNSEQALEMAAQFAEYGNVVVAFAVAQGLAFAFLMGRNDPLRRPILDAGPMVNRWLVGASLLYGALALLCGIGELNLRAYANPPARIYVWTSLAMVGRVIIVAATALLAWYALAAQRKEKSDDPTRGGDTPR